jgi:hypothetical protein
MPRQLEENTRLVSTRQRPVSFSNWPELVRDALGHLVDAANDAGAQTGLGELSAALVYEATTRLESGDELLDVVMQYRKAKVSDLQSPED